MNLFVIGDVHGCYLELKKLIEEHWNSKDELLIQVGDLIDRGSFSPRTVEYCRGLKKQFPSNVVFLKGNHEFEIIYHFLNEPNENWLRQCGYETLEQYKSENKNPIEDVNWFLTLPLYWENENIFISHAGLSEIALNCFEETDPHGVLWNRGKVKNINKLQIIGHTPCENSEPIYNEEENSLNIDTGAGYKDGVLTGVKLNEKGEILKIIKINT